MTRTLRLPIVTMTAILIAVMWLASAAQAGAPQISPIPQPRPQAQADCDTRASVIKMLKEKYGEVRRAAGLALNLTGEARWILEIFASGVTGTWTIVKHMPNGRSCLIIVGTNWHDAKPIPTGDPA